MGLEGVTAGLAESLPEETRRVREGVDFASQAEAAALVREARAVRVRWPVWARLLLRVQWELRMWEATGALPGGKVWSEQPAWKVELWTSWWLAR